MIEKCSQPVVLEEPSTLSTLRGDFPEVTEELEVASVQEKYGSYYRTQCEFYVKE